MILAIVDHDHGELREDSLEAVTLARGIDTVEALVIGADGAGIVEKLGAHGVHKVHLAQHVLLDEYGPDTWAETARQLAEQSNAQAVFAIGSDRGNEIVAQVAARLDLPMLSNVFSITSGDTWRASRTRWGGSLHEEVDLVAGLKLITVAPHAVDATEIDGSTPLVELFTPTLSREGATRVLGTEGTSGGITLAEARVVVCGGRGVGSTEGFSVLTELAGELGGVVGCSRVATNSGWRPHSDQVGQTGTRIAPDLYIGCGVSGAIQHWVGMMASKNIMAINTDPEAPMVTKAEYALVGDLHEIVPALLQEIRRRKGQHSDQ